MEISVEAEPEARLAEVKADEIFFSPAFLLSATGEDEGRVEG